MTVRFKSRSEYQKSYRVPRSRSVSPQRCAPLAGLRSDQMGKNPDPSSDWTEAAGANDHPRPKKSEVTARLLDMSFSQVSAENQVSSVGRGPVLVVSLSPGVLCSVLQTRSTQQPPLLTNENGRQESEKKPRPDGPPPRKDDATPPSLPPQVQRGHRVSWRGVEADISFCLLRGNNRAAVTQQGVSHRGDVQADAVSMATGAETAVDVPVKPKVAWPDHNSTHHPPTSSSPPSGPFLDHKPASSPTSKPIRTKQKPPPPVAPPPLVLPPQHCIQGTLRHADFQHNDDRLSEMSWRSAASCSAASAVLERAQKRRENFWGKT
ncbi:hypothetical protein FQN60_005622 [Etheostoma spectabile]|uniref:Nuclear protein MDM1 n=1 Tax=Etheostoma spectabile TaxID=54343 RepID=A0A5J5CEB8_9PERO|nr:hypothetical protein FQN60_005622 [Etheostoma spectabile]